MCVRVLCVCVFRGSGGTLKRVCGNPCLSPKGALLGRIEEGRTLQKVVKWNCRLQYVFVVMTNDGEIFLDSFCWKKKKKEETIEYTVLF